MGGGGGGPWVVGWGCKVQECEYLIEGGIGGREGVGESSLRLDDGVGRCLTPGGVFCLMLR